MNEMSDQTQNPVPVTIVSGFLGSGKTTMINFLLNEIGSKEKLAIIKNEIGDVAVDSKIIRGKNIIMKELLNGCVCCTLVGELEDSLKELVDTVHPDRIIIEASGAANPAILAVNLDRMAFVRRELIVTMIDLVNFEGYKDKTIVGRLQHKFTDMVVLNRVGDVDEDTVEEVLDDVYEVRPGIPVVKTKTGRVDPDVLFGLRDGMKRITFSGEAANDQNLHKDHLHEDDIESFTFSVDTPLERECFEYELGRLSEEYYRVKGFVWFEDGVKLVNFVCGRYELEAVQSDVLEQIKKNETKIAFIGKDVGKYKDRVCERLSGCTAK